MTECSLTKDELIIKNPFITFKIESDCLTKNSKKVILRVINENDTSFVFERSHHGLILSHLNSKFIFELSMESNWVSIEFEENDIISVLRQLADLCEDDIYPEDDIYSEDESIDTSRYLDQEQLHNPEYIKSILFNYINKNIDKKNNSDKKSSLYFYNQINDINFTGGEVYWTLSQKGIITIKSCSPEEAIILDIALEVLFMDTESCFHYYMDIYYKNIDTQSDNILIEDFFDIIMKSYLISEGNEKLNEICRNPPTILNEDDSEEILDLNLNEVIIYDKEKILNLLQVQLPKNKIHRVKELLNIK